MMSMRWIGLAVAVGLALLSLAVDCSSVPEVDSRDPTHSVLLALGGGVDVQRATRTRDEDDDDDDSSCPPGNPALAQMFMGDIHSVFVTAVGAVDNTRTSDGTWTVDTVGGKMRFVGDTATGIAPLSQPTLACDMGWLPTEGWSLLNGQCRPNEPYSWSANWGWLGCATHVDTVDCWPTDGEEQFDCERYAVSDRETFFVGADVWTDPESVTGVPIAFDSWFLYSLGSQLVNATATYTMTNVSLDVPGDAFAMPTYCAQEPPSCPDTGDDISTMSFTRIHTASDWKFSNRNIADLTGDVGYICELPADTNDSLLTLFDLTVNTTWGQYALCNQDECKGGTPGTVGHSGTAHYGQPLAGMCSENEGIGNWYSIAAEDECMEGQVIGDSGCAWQGPLRILKTIAHSCLIERGFLNACVEDERIPFPAASAIVQQALLPESDGGCPDVTDAYYGEYSSNNESSDDHSPGVFVSSAEQSTGTSFLPPSGVYASSDETTLLSSVVGGTGGGSSSDSDVVIVGNSTTDGAGDGDLTSEADYVFIALSFGCMILACGLVTAIMAYGVLSYIKNRPQQFGWAIAGNDEQEPEDAEAI